MANKTETELLRATILALGGACDDLPDNLESTLYKRLIEVCASAGGGGGSGGGGTLVVRVNNVQLDENLNVVSGTASHSHTEVYSALASGRNVSYIIEMVMPDYDAATYETRTVRMAIPDAVVIRSNDPNGTEYMHIGDMVAYFQE